MNHILSVNTQDYTRKYPYEYCLRIWAKTYYLFDSTGLGLVSNLISKNDSCTKPGLPIGPRRLLLSQPSDLKPTASGTSTWMLLKPGSKTFMKPQGSPGFRHRRTARAQPAVPVAWSRGHEPPPLEPRRGAGAPGPGAGSNAAGHSSPCRNQQCRPLVLLSSGGEE